MAAKFNHEHREAFRMLVREQRLDESACIDETERIATRWLRRFGPPQSTLLTSALKYKAAGYNVELHAWAIRALRAARAADTWLGDAREVTFECGDLLLGEYFLLERAKARGVRVSTVVPWNELVANLCSVTGPRCQSPGFERLELALDTAPATSCGAWSGLPLDALFIATMGTYVNPMVPVMNELARSGRRAALLAPAASQRWGALAGLDAKVERIAIESLMTRELRSLWRKAAEETTRRWEACEIDIAKTMSVQGISLWPLVREDLRAFASGYVPYARVCEAMGRELGRARRVGVTVCARLRRASEIALCEGLMSAGARSAMVIHGHVSAEPGRGFIDGDFTIPDRIAVWGAAQRAAVVAKGAPAERVVATGNPAWDGTAAWAGQDREVLRRELCERVGFQSELPLVLLASQADAAPQLGAIVSTALRTPRLQLLVRPHPAEPTGPFEAMKSAGAVPRLRLLRGEDGPELPKLLRACDALITLHSTVNMEAIAVGTPVITAAIGDLARSDRLVRLEQYGLPLTTTPADLAAVLDELAGDPVAWREARRLGMERACEALLTGPGATARVTAMLIELGTASRREAA